MRETTVGAAEYRDLLPSACTKPGERVQLDWKLTLVAVQLNKQNVFAFLFAASRLGFSNFPRTSAPDAHASAAPPMGTLPQPRGPAGAALPLAGWARAQKDEAEP